MSELKHAETDVTSEIFIAEVAERAKQLIFVKPTAPADEEIEYLRALFMENPGRKFLRCSEVVSSVRLFGFS